jgi:integrase
MAAYFLDTSTVVKRYAQEVGTPWVQALADPTAGHLLAVVRITLAETVAAVTRLCGRPHKRVATVTDLLGQNVPLEDVQYLAGHADPRTTRIYDRRRRKVTRNIVERISI